MSSKPLDGELADVVNRVSGKVVGTVVQSGTVGGTATAPGGYANAGVHTGDVNLFTGVPVLTRYRQQVRRIAPRELVGRDDELAELAEFCISSTGGYAWWRAAAWSGKSALMSWFVLNPPPGVRVVSFFITARLAGQNRRSAFIDNVMEQLLALTGQPPPAFLTDANRESHLLGLLDDAAAACRERGEQFVLLVDGLDEDLGVHTGTDAHSIAALLPEGIRVIVAGRPDPVLPADVPEHHPLRDPSIVRRLAPSFRAQVIRVEAERELRALLHGAGLGLDLLGLVTASGGGLTSADLAELTATSEWAVHDLLKTVAGRSFTRRRTSSDVADTYLLGHEELQATAVDVLGPAKLGHYRRLLHTWADVHRDQGWTTSTPDYLLRGYFAMLVEVGDVPRMLACATDPARQDLSLSASGGDANLLDEIAATQAVTTDLVTLTRLAVHRDFLGHRNADIPANLPAAWLAVGRAKRATAAVRSIVDPVRHLDAMIAMARVVDDGNLNVLLIETRAAIELIENGVERSARLTSLVVVAGSKGNLDLAESLIGSQTDEHQVSVLIALACAAARAGDERWGRLLSRVEPPHGRSGIRTTAVDCNSRLPPSRLRSAILTI